MEINIKENIKMVNFMGKVNIHGLMDHVIKDSLLMVLDMVKVAGNHVKIMEISISALMKVIKKMDMVDMFGLMDVSMKEDLLMTLSIFDII